MNYTFQPVLEAHNLNPLDTMVVEELGGRGDHPEGGVTHYWREPNMRGPIATSIPG